MKVFVSWSGERSKALALALRDWLPLVLPYVEPWLSEFDIEAGERWPDAVATELEASNFGIICLTRGNVEAPWVLFEAGALAKSMQGSKVIPLLLDLDLSDLKMPLALFQAKKADESGLEDVVTSIHQAAGEAEPVERVRQRFKGLWNHFEERLDEIPEDDAGAKRPRPEREVLEELVAGVRALDLRFREVADMPPSFRRRRRWHPMMIEEVVHMTAAEEPGHPLPILMMASLFREDVPWVYELGLDAYRAARHDPPKEARLALDRFRRAAEFCLRGPFAREFMIDRRELHMLFRELEHFMFRDEPVPEPERPTSSKQRARRKPSRTATSGGARS